MASDQLTRSLQRASLKEYCLAHNVSLEEFAQKKYENYKAKIQEFSNHRNAVTNLFLKMGGLHVPNSPSIESILDLDYKISEAHRTRCLAAIDAFFAKNSFKTFLIDADILKKRCERIQRKH
jgi:hypothetical protein